MLEWIAPQEYTTNSTDDGQAYDEAWQAQNQITQNDTVRFRNGECFRNPIKFTYIYKGQEEKVPKTPS